MWYENLKQHETELHNDPEWYSENGESKVCAGIFNHIPIESKYYVEFGANRAFGSNTQWFAKNNWNGLVMDGEDYKLDKGTVPVNFKKEWITADNINELFEKYSVPKTLDLLSIDIDSNDYWVLKSILQKGIYIPKVIVIEFNPNFESDTFAVMPRNDSAVKDGTTLYGASLFALNQLCEHYKYKLIHVMSKSEGCADIAVSGRNAIFIQSKYLPEDYSVDLKKLHPVAWKEPYKKRYEGPIKFITSDIY